MSIAVLPFLLGFLTLDMLDSLSMYFVVPSLMFQGVCVTSMYYTTRSLQAPLWNARQMYYFGVFGVMASMLASYKLLAVNLSQDESRKVFLNIQMQLDSDMKSKGIMS